MHGQIDVALCERLFNLLGEHALRADLREGHFLQFVAGGLDDFNCDCVALFAKKSRDVIGLPERQLRATASDAEFHLPPTTLVSFNCAGFSDVMESSLVPGAGGFVSASGSAVAGSDHVSHSASRRA